MVAPAPGIIHAGCAGAAAAAGPQGALSDSRLLCIYEQGANWPDKKALVFQKFFSAIWPCGCPSDPRISCLQCRSFGAEGAPRSPLGPPQAGGPPGTPFADNIHAGCAGAAAAAGPPRRLLLLAAGRTTATAGSGRATGLEGSLGLQDRPPLLQNGRGRSLSIFSGGGSLAHIPNAAMGKLCKPRWRMHDGGKCSKAFSALQRVSLVIRTQ